MTNSQLWQNGKKWAWLWDLLLILVLALGAYFRYTGVKWGDFLNQHPDENFLTSVISGIQAIGTPADQLGPPPTSETMSWRTAYPKAYPDCKAWGGYFSTACSPMNPPNRGYAFYVYGDLPLFIVRYAADLFHQLGNVTLFGRQVSAAVDLGTIVLLYFIVKRLYKRWVALLAAAFSALAVMQIQQSHFFTTDNFLVFFMTLTLLFAVLIATGRWKRPVGEAGSTEEPASAWNKIAAYLLGLVKDPLAYLCLAFGLSLGMAAGSKITAAVMAALLPVALMVRYYRREGKRPAAFGDFVMESLVFLAIGGIATILSFRIFQPYAFSGLWFSPQWVANIKEVLNQSSPKADLPWALQWARRSHLYSFENLTVWGLGLPLGILAWSGFLWMGWRILKGEWREHLVVWAWTAGYFLWQSMAWNPTMRYQLPIYPLLAMMAAWAVIRLWDLGQQAVRGRKKTLLQKIPPAAFRAISLSLGSLVLLLTGIWAFMFTRIYVRTEPREAASIWISENIAGPINLRIQTAEGKVTQQPLPYSSGGITPESPYITSFAPLSSGSLNQVLLGHVVDTSLSGQGESIRLTISTSPDISPDQVLATAATTAVFGPGQDGRGPSATLTFDQPLMVAAEQTYYMQISVSGGSLSLSGDSFANETDYDYTLPFRMPNFDPFGGIYRGDLNLQVYWDDNADKLNRIETTLDQSDYLFIPTAHQYSQITRIPERYPLTTVYYRNLIGCPAEKDILWCYRVARPGMFQGNLGFDLVAVFTSYPSLGSFQINDQSAEEAFTFYDHPKVMIFKKDPATYDAAKVQAILGAVDYSQAVRLVPGQVNGYKSLMLQGAALAIQQAGGTWSQLFHWNDLQNKYPYLGLIVWYLVILALGVCTYPLVRAALPGLRDRGYPLARVAGLLLWAWFAWMAGSIGLTYSRLTIALCLALVVVIGGVLAYRQREELAEEWRKQKRYFLLVEGLFLAFFLLDLAIRLGNPDLWHESKGGERPMDFAYFNAILKSTTFPPYDPWFAGGYINYYYYGYVIVGTPVKLLGIVPSIAFNFILPTLFAMLGMGAFSVGWNLLSGRASPVEGELDEFTWQDLLHHPALWAGLAGAAAVVLLGNLGIPRLYFQGFQRLVAPGGAIDNASFFQHISWAVRGFFRALSGTPLPYGPGDWYWFPSRALPDSSGGPITEFPFFTFLYSDLHPNMMAYPLTVLAIAWVLSLVLSRAKWKGMVEAGLGLFLGALVIGALRPANTWDFYTYLALAEIVLVYCLWRYAEVDRIPVQMPEQMKRLVLCLGAAAALAILSMLLYQPFNHYFYQAYNSIQAWKDGRSNLSSYLVHWGVFLFFVVSWMTWETREWLASTPLSSLRKLQPYVGIILAAVLFLILLLVYLQFWVMKPENGGWRGVTVLWLAMPLAAWAGVLILRPGLPDIKRLVLFMIGTSLFLTMFVEIFVVAGDVGRQNTVFKFYLQAWIMLGLSSGAGLVWLLPEIRKWLSGWRISWGVAASLLVAGAGLFMLIGGSGKIRDRMAPLAPHTLDSMTYMAYAQYSEYGVTMNLAEDYRAIRWMQENVKGSPVISEAAAAGVQYAWLSRFSIYTGLPDVVGWQWHQQQQRVMQNDEVIARGQEQDAFYTTADINAARAFLQKYAVRYIIVGQLERAKYAPGAPGGPVLAGEPDGLAKFEQYNGALWQEVYRDGQTVIYQVLP